MSAILCQATTTNAILVLVRLYFCDKISEFNLNIGLLSLSCSKEVIIKVQRSELSPFWSHVRASMLINLLFYLFSISEAFQWVTNQLIFFCFGATRGYSVQIRTNWHCLKKQVTTIIILDWPRDNKFLYI